MQSAHFGLTGLAVMGQNLARNVARNGFPIAVHNRTAERTSEFASNHGTEGDIRAATTLEDLVHALQPPRAILMMVKAGSPVDDVIHQLQPLLKPGDTLIDGGNSLFTDTIRRIDSLRDSGINYLGVGVSGGEEGALWGPSIMPGGTREGYEAVANILSAISAKVDGEPCCTYVGADGAGHYVKMVHNGIEYADMQLIAEAYDLLSSVCGLSNPQLADVFDEWNRGDLDSFLIQITAEIFRTRDPETGGWLVDQVMDKAAQKGTGKWTSQSALDLGVPCTTITEAVFARCLSSFLEERRAAALALTGPAATVNRSDGLIEDIRQALYASKIVAYAQGFDQMQAAAAEYHWDLHPGEIAAIWRGGCIIRARFLNRITDAYRLQPTSRLVHGDYFKDALRSSQSGWRRVISLAVQNGVPVPAFSSALAWYDGYRRERLPANLIQAQRDLFGAHTYERLDRAGTFHSRWGADGTG